MKQFSNHLALLAIVGAGTALAALPGTLVAQSMPSSRQAAASAKSGHSAFGQNRTFDDVVFQPLAGDALQKFFDGYSVILVPTGATRGMLGFDPGGKWSFELQASVPDDYFGRWSIQNDHICVETEDPGEDGFTGCRRVFVNEHKRLILLAWRQSRIENVRTYKYTLSRITEGRTSEEEAARSPGRPYKGDNSLSPQRPIIYRGTTFFPLTGDELRKEFIDQPIQFEAGDTGDIDTFYSDNRWTELRYSRAPITVFGSWLIHENAICVDLYGEGSATSRRCFRVLFDDNRTKAVFIGHDPTGYSSKEWKSIYLIRK